MDQHFTYGALPTDEEYEKMIDQYRKLRKGIHPQY